MSGWIINRIDKSSRYNSDSLDGRGHDWELGAGDSGESSQALKGRWDNRMQGEAARKMRAD